MKHRQMTYRCAAYAISLFFIPALDTQNIVLFVSDFHCFTVTLISNLTSDGLVFEPMIP